MTARLGAVLCVVFCVVATAAPADPVQELPLWGAGKMTCRDWQRANRADQRAAENWVFGYLNAYNYFQNGRGPYVGQAMTDEQVASWIENRCRKNPSATVGLIAYQIGDDFDSQSEDRN